MRQTALLLTVAIAGCVRARAPERGHTAPLRDVTLVVDAELSGIPPGAKELRLWIPVPRDEGAQVLTRTIPEAPANAAIVTDTRRGNGALLVVLPSPASSASARVSYEISRAEQRGAAAAHPLAHVEKRGDPTVWLADDRLGAVDDQTRMIALGFLHEGWTNREKARAAYDYVLANMRYSGDCTDFHALFIAIMRAGGIPARFRIGFSLPPDEKEGTLAGYHCWSEWWDPDRGWTPVDISEARKHPEKKEALFGGLDNDRIGVSLGRDLVFEGQKGPALNYFVFPYAEVDGQPFPVATTVTFRDR